MKLALKTGFTAERRGALALLMILLAGNPTLLAAQQATAPKPQPAPARSTVEEEETAAPAKGPGHEGIHVSGHWIMDVHDKDGRIVEHRDFHNSLYENGGGVLLRLLAGTGVAEKFAIILQTTTAVQYSIVTAGSLSATDLCNTTQNYVCSSGLTQTLKSTNQSGIATSLVVAGQLTAQSNITFNHVVSDITYCHNTQLDNNANSMNQNPISVSPTQCDAGGLTAPLGPGGGYFTGTDITPLTLSAGQVLTVSITISFS